jgi:hypothetical protein
MRKYIYLILIGFLCLTGCVGVNGVNTRASESEDYRQNRPSLGYEGTGLTDPHKNEL